MTKPFAYFRVELLRHKRHLGLVRIDEKSPVSKASRLTSSAEGGWPEQVGTAYLLLGSSQLQSRWSAKKHLDLCLSVHSVGASPILYLMDNGSKIEDDHDDD
jgi:hypothetical protein